MRPRRLVVLARGVARRCAAAATYGASVAWFCTYGVVYAAVALVVTTAVAAVCWIVSGE